MTTNQAQAGNVIFTRGKLYKLTTIVVNQGNDKYASAYTWIKSKKDWSKNSTIHHFREYEILNEEEIKNLGC